MFAVVGEAVVDLVERSDGGFDAHPGGSPLNVAVALARLGQPTTLHVRVSRGGLGQRLREHARVNGVDLRHAIDAPEPATLAAVTLDAAGQASYEFYVDGTADWLWTGDELAAAPGDARVVHVGSLACLMAPGHAELLALVERIRMAGDTLLSYDPNIRPGLPGGDVRGLVERYVRAVHIVKASEEDLRTLYPGKDPQTVAARWRASGPSLVVVTRGGDGADAVTAAGTVHHPTKQVNVVDTIGAGDAFTAGMLAAVADRGLHTPATVRHLSGAALSEVLEHAMLVAALTCTRAGAEPPHHQLLAEVGVGVLPRRGLEPRAAPQAG